jgi:hypothetical protein
VVYLATSAVATGNGSALARGWRLVVLLDVLRRRWWLLAIWIWWRRSASPLIGTWQAVWLLVLVRVLVLVLGMLSHVGTGLLGGRRRERGVHLDGRQVSASCQTAYEREHDVQPRVTADLRGEAAHTSHSEAAGPWAVASGREAGLGHPGEGTW